MRSDRETRIHRSQLLQHAFPISALADGAAVTGNMSRSRTTRHQSLGIMSHPSRYHEEGDAECGSSTGKASSWSRSHVDGSRSSADHHANLLHDMRTGSRGKRGKRGRRLTGPYTRPVSEEPTASPLMLQKTPIFPVADGVHGSSDVGGGGGGLGSEGTGLALEGSQIRAFAKLEFDDGPFYMNTYAVELGRDVRAARSAAREDSQARLRAKHKKRSSSLGNGPQTPALAKRDGSVIMHRSVVSESGGIMALDIPDLGGGYRRRKSKSHKHSKVSRSTASSSPPAPAPPSRGRDVFDPRAPFLPAAVISHNPLCPHPVDPLTLLPSPEECPLIPIHPPALSAETGGHKGISRKHVKIAFNFDRHLFELHIKGKNGAFVDDHWHAEGETLPLRSGAHIQIGGVSLRFVLPEVAAGGPDGAAGDVEEVESVGEAMDVAGEESSGDGIVHSLEEEEVIWLEEDETVASESSDEDDNESEDDSEDEAVDEEKADEGEGEEDEGDDEDDEMEVDAEGQVQAEVEEQAVESSPSPPPVPKKRGPGRPPKNGHTAQPRRKKTAVKAEKPVPTPVPPKRKVGRPRKHPLPENEPAPRVEKRKYTRRKGVEARPASEEKKKTKEEGEEADEAPRVVKEKKEKRPAKPPRSPSPVFVESELTAEQLQKPQQSYVVLIHEALSNSKSGPMSLPQIYRAIERRYPYFKLRVTTNGWQSSVRHNLSQHDAFQKVERDGKGWMWGLVPGVSIEKEKRRKASSPGPTAHPSMMSSSSLHSGREREYASSSSNGAGLGYSHPSQVHKGPLPNGHGYFPRPGFPGGRMTTAGLNGHAALHSLPLPPPPPMTTPTTTTTASHSNIRDGRIAAEFGPPPSSSSSQAGRMYQSPYATATLPTAASTLTSSRPQQVLPQPGSTTTAAATSTSTSNSATTTTTATPVKTNGTANNPKPDLVTAIQDFKSALVNSMSHKTNRTQSEVIVQRAINRVLGLPPPRSAAAAPDGMANGNGANGGGGSSSSGNGGNGAGTEVDVEERMIMKALRGLIARFTTPTGTTATSSSSGGVAPPPASIPSSTNTPTMTTTARKRSLNGDDRGGSAAPVSGSSAAVRRNDDANHNVDGDDDNVDGNDVRNHNGHGHLGRRRRRRSDEEEYPHHDGHHDDHHPVKRARIMQT